MKTAVSETTHSQSQPVLQKWRHQPASKNVEILREEFFTYLIALERKRSDRSGKPFMLILLDIGRLSGSDLQAPNGSIKKVLSALGGSVRETDTIGWYRGKNQLGVLFTEFGAAQEDFHYDIISKRVLTALRHCLGEDERRRLKVSLHHYPEKFDSTADSKLYPDLRTDTRAVKQSIFTKRAIDILGSLLMLIVLSPLWLMIAALIKLTSRGPVIFKQERLGKFGQPFTFLKFRSMDTETDHKIHEEYIQKFISGDQKSSAQSTSLAPEGVYKITNDPRVTFIGRLLRKTSLDELPQVLNVLKGEMSLVGPRPPIAYEFERYDVWQRRRVLEAKPGITGLWQVKGRSRTTFDDMVRLDLSYISHRSLWLDLSILLRTPWAVLKGDGAY